MSVFSTIRKLNRKFETESDIDKFVQYQIQNRPQYANQRLDQLIQAQEFLVLEKMENAFDGLKQKQNISPVFIEHIRGICARGVQAVNELPPETRFWIQLTVASRNNLYECADIVLRTSHQARKNMIHDHFLKKFAATYDVIEMLERDERLFAEGMPFHKENLHGLLKQLAEKIINYGVLELDDSDDDETDKAAILYHFIRNHTKEEILESLSDDRVLVNASVDYFSVLNTSPHVMEFARARNYKLKLFLIDISTQDMFEGMDPYDLVRILTGLLVVNTQIDPDLEDELSEEPLTKKLLHQDTFELNDTRMHLMRFLEQLSPLIIDDLVKTMMFVIQKVKEDTSDYEVLNDIRAISATEKFGIDLDELGEKVTKGFKELTNRGMGVLATFGEMFQQLKEKYNHYQEIKQQQEPVEVVEDQVADPEPEEDPMIQKNPEYEAFAEKLRFVQSDTIDYKEDRDTPIRLYREIHIAFGGNENESFTGHLKNCLFCLFDTKKLPSLDDDRISKRFHVTILSPFSREKPGSLSETLFAVGLTKVTGRDIFHDQLYIQNQDIVELDPYIIKLRGIKDVSQVNEIKPRKVVLGDVTVHVHAVPIGKSSYREIYDLLVLLLHLLPPDESGFYSPSAQFCITFLNKQLEKLGSS
ncbi:MAG: hypothetical protein HQM11_05785 [SAR324 cluster bacterium]|nr:hypothetical protein [SAR324 cluster bacterium]